MEGHQPFKAVLDGDHAALAATGEKGLVEIMTVAHSGMTTDDFLDLARNWLKTARHPRFNRPYSEVVYQPMLELLAYLRATQFQTGADGKPVLIKEPKVEFVEALGKRS
jgi:hypothetical protein